MAISILHFIKMSWMLIWRVTLFTLFFAFAQGWKTNLIWASLALSAFLVFGLGKAVKTFPIIRFIFRQDVVIYLDEPKTPYKKPTYADKAKTATKSPVTATPPAIPNPIYRTKTSPLPYVSGDQINKATQNGRMTGFEPDALKYFSVPRIGVGVPGAGLQNATGMTQKNISLGILGEQNFAKALYKTGKSGKFKTVWSVPVPAMDKFEPNKYGTDIDCVIATADHLFLIDLKNYKSGNVQYYNVYDELFCVDNVTRQPIGDAKKMSRNMEMATNSVKKHFPKANVVPVVVFMPTDKGEGELLNVEWPGGIPAVNLSEFLIMLEKQNSPSHLSFNNDASSKLGDLVKKHVMPTIKPSIFERDIDDPYFMKGYEEN